MKRGNYFEYLKDSNLPIPYTTLRDRRKREHELREQQAENEGEMEIDNDILQELNPDVIQMPVEGREALFERDNNEEILDDIVDRDVVNPIREDLEIDEHQLAGDLIDEERAHEILLNDNDDDGAAEDVDLEGLEDDIQAAYDNEPQQAREIIYPGSSLTKEESDLLIMSFAIRHGITDVALEDLLQLINCHLPESINASKYLFLKKFPSIVNFTRHYYCPDCFTSLTFEGEQQATCISCHKHYHQYSLDRSSNYFAYIPLKEQLQKLLSGPLFHKLQRDCPEPGILLDVTSGKAYKKLRQNGVISDYDITIQWNADGVQTFKSSKVSMCPVQVAINELPYRTRKENIMLTALWCSAQKPVLDLYLKPFVDELRDLHENGFHCSPPGFQAPVTVKVHTLLAPVDSVARCALQNIHQFNGEFGCSLCLHPGEHVNTGNGYTRVYCGDEGDKRTTEQHNRDAIKATIEKTVINGVKGVSLLMLLPIFSIITSFPPEYMHSVLLGVVRLFLTSWFDSSNYNEPWYLGAKKHLFDERLGRIRPPCEITRTPRSISDIKNWKASEFKNFLLYYSLPCLKDLIPMVYYRHWSLLVFAIQKFNSEKINEQDFEQAKRAIREFVRRTEPLYGQRFMKFNVHLLLHIPSSVKYFGALWAWSAFYFESYNYVLRNMLKNSQAILHQICKAYLRFQTLEFNDTFNKNNCSLLGKHLYLSMVGNYKTRTGHRLSSDSRLILFGNGNNVVLNLIEKLSIQTVLSQDIKVDAVSYERFIFNNILYHSCAYEKLCKRDNSIVKISSGALITITKILCVSQANDRKTFVVIGRAFEILDDILCSTNYITSGSYSNIVRQTQNITVCFPTDILNKCVISPLDDDSKCVIVPLVNTVETD